MRIYIFFLILISTISVESKEIFSNYPQPVERSATYVSATDRYMQLFGRETLEIGCTPCHQAPYKIDR